jgi:hypothetical protein
MLQWEGCAEHAVSSACAQELRLLTPFAADARDKAYVSSGAAACRACEATRGHLPIVLIEGCEELECCDSALEIAAYN